MHFSQLFHLLIISYLTIVRPAMISNWAAEKSKIRLHTSIAE